MQQHDRTFEYWPTRILLCLGVMGTVLVVGFAITFAFPPAMMGGDHTMAAIGPLSVPQTAVVGFVAGVMALTGLVWQVRVFRGQRETPPAWRYRER